MTDFLVAAALLFGESQPPSQPTPGVQVAFARLADHLGVGSPITEDDYFPSAVHQARAHLRDLVDAPPFCDTRRLPPTSLINRWADASRQARSILKARASIVAHQRVAIELALEDDSRRHYAVLAMAVAADPMESVPARRVALRDLRRLIGPQAYAQGIWPAPVPFGLLPNLP